MKQAWAKISDRFWHWALDGSVTELDRRATDGRWHANDWLELAGIVTVIAFFLVGVGFAVRSWRAG